MELQKQVTSLELSNRLEKLGVPQNSYFVWHSDGGTHPNYVLCKNDDKNYPLGTKRVAAYTVAELLNIAPSSTSMLKRTDAETNTHPRYYVETFEYYRDSDWDENPAEALGLMIEYLLTNNLLSL